MTVALSPRLLHNCSVVAGAKTWRVCHAEYGEKDVQYVLYRGVRRRGRDIIG